MGGGEADEEHEREGDRTDGVDPEGELAPAGLRLTEGMALKYGEPSSLVSVTRAAKTQQKRGTSAVVLPCFSRERGETQRPPHRRHGRSSPNPCSLGRTVGGVVDKGISEE